MLSKHHNRNRPSPVSDAHRCKTIGQFSLKNSRLTVIDGPALIGRIDHEKRGTEWALLDWLTLESIEEVGRNG